jgi:archaellum biogenesis protein FlaJ (TadC family)
MLLQAVTATPIPYSPRTDDFISVTLLLCFFLSAFVMSRNKKYLLLQLKNFFQHRDRASIFSASSSVDMRLLLALALQTCILASICIFNFFVDSSASGAATYSSWKPIMLFTLLCAGYLFVKNILYTFIGWVFFGRGESERWTEAYLTLIYSFGFLLFPFVLLLIYFDLNATALIIIGLLFVVCVKMLELFKWFRFFFQNKSGTLLLIVYFCALEIIPCFLLYRGLVDLNELFTIKL